MRVRLRTIAGLAAGLLLLAIVISGCQLVSAGTATTTSERLKPPDLKLLIPEGLSVDQTAERLESSSKLDGEEYVRLAQDPAAFRLPTVGGQVINPPDLEGLLFPSTYYLMDEDGPQVLIGLQLLAFSQKTAELPWERTLELGLKPYQVLIVASMIEKEARIPGERAKVAAVIYNRLKRNMLLGVDATVRFALKKWTGSLTKSDLEVDSPYNTRTNRGLPPGPICSPGLAALRAALQPADADYLYYVLMDEAGHHFFTASYDEFTKAKQRSTVD